MKLNEWYKVADLSFDELETGLYIGAYHAKNKVGIFDLNDVYDSDGRLKDAYLLNYIESHISHLMKIESPKHPNY